MALLELPSEILCSLFSYLGDKQSAQFTETCKETVAICKENGGYLSKITLEPNIKGKDYIQHYTKHARTIENVYIQGQENPHLWIFEFPRFVNCSNCKLTEQFIPNGGTICKTERLIFRNIGGPEVEFKTDWNLFPNLRRLVLYVDEIDTNDIPILEKLPCLETVAIYTKNGTFKRDKIGDKIEFKSGRDHLHG